MANERRGDRRQPSRPGGGGYGDFRPYRGRPPRGGADEPGQRDYVPRRPQGGFARPPSRQGYERRPADEGGMSIRVDPRRLSFLKELAAAEGLRPGQLVQRWIEERLDAERTGESMPSGRTEPQAGATDQRMALLEAHLTTLTSRVEEMVERLHALEGAGATVAPSTPAAQATAAEGTALATPRRRGRPPKERRAEEAPTPAAQAAGRRTRRRRPATPGGGRIALHDEIIAVIGERGPMTAAELAGAIKERGRYRAPRSARPLDAAIINSRVSNPVYRGRFRREGGRIGLAK